MYVRDCSCCEGVVICQTLARAQLLYILCNLCQRDEQGRWARERTAGKMSKRHWWDRNVARQTNRGTIYQRRSKPADF